MNKTRCFSITEGPTTKNYEIVSGYPTCQGCENLTVTRLGWCCMFNGENGQGCEYPTQMISRGDAVFVGSSTVIQGDQK